MGSFQKVGQVFNCGQFFCFHDGFHAPIMNKSPKKFSLFQTHLILEIRPTFRLISYWTRLPGKELTYSQSITDACLAWEDSVPLLELLARGCTQSLRIAATRLRRDR
ncbi:hypothetical protein [Thiolapillus sp.]|uniref:hypothetical protein n=1 Tax=Thiolapillus sp. TaxID=2017437 RepID=UPI003AF78367